MGYQCCALELITECVLARVRTQVAVIDLMPIYLTVVVVVLIAVIVAVSSATPFSLLMTRNHWALVLSGRTRTGNRCRDSSVGMGAVGTGSAGT